MPKTGCATFTCVCLLSIRAPIPPPHPPLGGRRRASGRRVGKELLGPAAAQAEGQAVLSSVTLDGAGRPEVHFRLELVTVPQKELVWQVRSPETSEEAAPSPPGHKRETSRETLSGRGWCLCQPRDSSRRLRPPPAHLTCFLTPTCSPQSPTRLRGERRRWRPTLTRARGVSGWGHRGGRNQDPVLGGTEFLTVPWDLGRFSLWLRESI